MTRLRGLAILMGAVVFIIGGFQVYWLRDNYQRANHELETKTGLLFRETFRELQDSLIKFRINSAILDSVSIGDIRVSRPFKMNNTAANVIYQLNKKKRGDSAQSKPVEMTITLKDREGVNLAVTDNIRPTTIDSMRPQEIEAIGFYNSSRDAVRAELDSAIQNRQRSFAFRTSNQIVLRMDSLFNDSVQVTELNKRFAQTLQRENIPVSFRIVEKDRNETQTAYHAGPTGRWMAVDRDAGPFQVQLGKVYPFLLTQLSLPILFSVFLVGITLFSFILLYRSLRRQQRLAQMKTDLINNITHELKTPIATVGVAIEALKNFNAIQDPTRTKEYLDISQQELQRLGLLVDKVLKLSMFEKKELELQTQLFNLGEVVDEVVASFRLQLEKYQARITVEKQGELLLKGDRLHMLSVVFNLLDNALKYSKGNAAIKVELLGGPQTLQMKVTDNGIGIPEAYKQKVFEKFFRVPAGDTHNAKGHGLGLSYVAQVIQQHGGSIQLDSHEGLGSTFTINLPAASNGSVPSK